MLQLALKKAKEGGHAGRVRGREAAAAAASLSTRTYDGRKLVVTVVDSRAVRDATPAQSETDPRLLEKEIAKANKAAKAAKVKAEDETARLAKDVKYHSAQHKLLQKRCDDLESELEALRASAKKDRDFHTQRIAALTKRSEDLERERTGLL